MHSGHLSQYFKAVAAKRLTEVEVNPRRSNQHEFQGVQRLREILGEPAGGEKVRFPARMIWMEDDKDPVVSDTALTWYDGRYKQPRPPEFRLYFPSSDASSQAHAGDLFILGKLTDGRLLIIMAAADSTIENQLLWLFNLHGAGVVVLDFGKEEGRELGFAARFIPDELGVETGEPVPDQYADLLAQFEGQFPKSKEFSALIQERLKDVDPLGAPDEALMAWMNLEESLFRQLERQIIEERLRAGFMKNGVIDVDEFIAFSLSVQNRRKVRAGLALENHLEEILKVHGIGFTRTGYTEGKVKPDFLFPSAAAYRDKQFPNDRLTMVGVKTSCKDRWRQVLSEAERVSNKHLLTLEPGISEYQTEEMKANSLQLVLPAALHSTYTKAQREWLMSVKDFIDLVKGRQTGLP